MVMEQRRQLSKVFLTHAPPCRLAQRARDPPPVDVNHRDLPQVQTTYDFALPAFSSSAPLSTRRRSPANRMTVCPARYV
jgi:hypothetical protein